MVNKNYEATYLEIDNEMNNALAITGKLFPTVDFNDAALMLFV